jgi:hypothetical protein
MAHISSLSTLDWAVPSDFFSVDFFWVRQFGRALWCQGVLGKVLGEIFLGGKGTEFWSEGNA